MLICRIARIRSISLSWRLLTIEVDMADEAKSSTAESTSTAASSPSTPAELRPEEANAYQLSCTLRDKSLLRAAHAVLNLERSLFGYKRLRAKSDPARATGIRAGPMGMLGGPVRGCPCWSARCLR